MKRKLPSDECFPTDDQLIEAARLQGEEMYPALPVKVDERRATRIVFEFCCGEDSLTHGTRALPEQPLPGREITLSFGQKILHQKILDRISAAKKQRIALA